mmetsp:Transcript_55372/g.147831  ORF Transcript_55372/g.147831 Transcript_55372/m.147831 type:complete len:208 (-) Transcript_55372:1094-1717(-)
MCRSAVRGTAASGNPHPVTNSGLHCSGLREQTASSRPDSVPDSWIHGEGVREEASSGDPPSVPNARPPGPPVTSATATCRCKGSGGVGGPCAATVVASHAPSASGNIRHELLQQHCCDGCVRGGPSCRHVAGLWLTRAREACPWVVLVWWRGLAPPRETWNEHGQRAVQKEFSEESQHDRRLASCSRTISSANLASLHTDGMAGVPA